MLTSKKRNNLVYWFLTELILLLIFIFICVWQFANGDWLMAIWIWVLLVFFGYLFGEFEPFINISFGINIRTEVIFVTTLIIYTLFTIRFNLLFWLSIWLYLNIIAPLIGLVIRRLFPVPVVLVNPIKLNTKCEIRKTKFLKWLGYHIAEQVTKQEFNDWLKNNSNSSGRISNYNAILIDITKHADIDASLGISESEIAEWSEKYFVNFIGIKSYQIIDYLLGFHICVLTKYPEHRHRTEYRIKRCIDFFICLAGLILSAPLFLFVILCIKLDSPGSVFYRHRRLGKNMNPFDLLKLRTMYQDADSRLEHILASDKRLREEFEKTFKLKKDPRITRTGKIIRQLSIDELPQALNVIKGDMSLVGPRPIVEKEIPYYKNYSLDLFRVLPGVTGLWQISGRTETTYEKRVKLDTQYVRNWSLFNDLMILIKTIPAVISQRGAY